MTHSKTPWRQVDTTIEDADGNLIIECKHGTLEERMCNARYAADAANSVQPLRDRLKERDADVETFADLVRDLRETRREARLQRDELLAALSRIADGVVMSGEFSHVETVETYQRIARAAIASHSANIPACEHMWVSARNKIVKSGEICVKCYALRAEPDLLDEHPTQPI